MSADDELVLLQACTTPRFLSQILPLVGLPERRCRDLLQRMKERRLVRLLRRRWTTTRSGERYAQELLAEAERKEHEAEAKRRRTQEMTATLQERLLGVLKEVQAVVSECQEIPLAADELRRLESELEHLRTLQHRLGAPPAAEDLGELERILNERLPAATAVAREVRAHVASLGLFEVVREPMVIDDPIWLLCTSCRLLQGQPRHYDGRYECPKCKRQGRAFVPSRKSIQSYVAPAGDRANEVDSRELLLRRLRKALQIYRLPGPVAEKILKFFDGSPMSPHDLHFACRLWMGEAGTRMIVTFVFQIPFNYPYPWPSGPWGQPGV